MEVEDRQTEEEEEGGRINQQGGGEVSLEVGLALVLWCMCATVCAGREHMQADISRKGFFIGKEKNSQLCSAACLSVCRGETGSTAIAALLSL